MASNRVILTSKTIGNKKTEYYYEGNQLSYEVIFENGILKEYRYYQWSPEQTVMGVAVKKQDSNGVWTTTPYHFITNHRGDVDDPISQNGYTYANNNPVMMVDSDGYIADIHYHIPKNRKEHHNLLKIEFWKNLPRFPW